MTNDTARAVVITGKRAVRISTREEHNMCCLCCMAVCACRLFLSSYLLFHLVYGTDKPLWLWWILTIGWLDLCFMFELSLNTLPLTIYTGTSLQYIPQRRYLDIDLEASEVAPFYLPYLVSQAEAIPLALFASPCSSLLVLLATSYWLQCRRLTRYVLKSAISYQTLAEDLKEKPPQQRASDNRIVPRLSQADVRSRRNTEDGRILPAARCCWSSVCHASFHFCGQG